MAREITVPRLGWTMEEGTFGGWLKADGDRVREGDELFLLESDKASEAITALDEGTLRIAPDGPRKGDVVSVGQRLGYLVGPGEPTPFTPAAAPARAAPAAAPVVTAAPEVGPPGPARRAISPRARRVAREVGIDCSGLAGSGRGGRIVERDVRAATHAGRLLPLTPVRRFIAERMAASAHTTAPVTLTTKADATALKAFRERLRKAAGPEGLVPGYTELVVKLAAQALADHPLLNARWQGEAVLLSDVVHVGVAVDTDAGLVVPVVRNVQALSLEQLTQALRTLVGRARQGKLRAEEMQGGTFTVTNLGMYGIDAFTPVINLPQCAILGVGRVVAEPAVHGGHIVPRDLVTLSLTFDHRVVDGGPAARFLNDVRRAIEDHSV
jgi:pyruvate dehydrogenase E2 component (dihydrolipoamide acetyltransferase)